MVRVNIKHRLGISMPVRLRIILRIWVVTFALGLVANGCDPKMMAQSHVIGFLWLILLLALGQASKFFRLLGL